MKATDGEYMKSLRRCRFSVSFALDDEGLVVLVGSRLHLEQQLVRGGLLDDPGRALD